MLAGFDGVKVPGCCVELTADKERTYPFYEVHFWYFLGFIP
jgi:hypothetical protein